MNKKMKHLKYKIYLIIREVQNSEPGPEITSFMVLGTVA